MKKRTNAKTNIVVVCWNALDYTKLTLSSLCATVHGEYYLTIVDNASTDGTVDYLKNIKRPKKCKKLNLIFNSKNIGYGGAINQGYEVSMRYDLKYTCVCNNDLLFQDDWLQEMEHCMEENTNIALLGAMRPSLDVFDPKTRKSLKEIVDAIPDSFTPDEEIKEITRGLSFEEFCKEIVASNENNVKFLSCPPETVVTCCAIIRNEAINQIGYLADPQFEIYGSEDIDLSWTIAKNGYQIAILNRIYVHHFRHKSIKSSGLDRDRSLTENNQKFYKKWKNELLFFLKEESDKVGSLESFFNTEYSYRYFFLRRINDKTNFYEEFMQMKDNLYTNDVKIDKPIGNLYRKNHILVLIKDKDGKYILGQKKNFYADGTARMLGGGLNDGEDPQEAAKREIEEETKIDVDYNDLFSLGTVITKADTIEGIMYMNVNLFGLVLKDDVTFDPSDDISGIKAYSQQELEELIRNMFKLEGEFRNDKFYFLHNDWGNIYGFIHNVALRNFLKHENTLPL